MKVRAKLAHRRDTVREDGSPGFQDVAAGQELEISDEQFTEAFYEVADQSSVSSHRSSVRTGH